MKVGFDLDGTLERPAIKALLSALLAGGHEIHVITGVFAEALHWQDRAAKLRKMIRHGIPFVEATLDFTEFTPITPPTGVTTLHILEAVPSTFPRDYRLIDLGLRKGALCEELGIELFIDDSETYVEMLPKMSGATSVLHVRN